MKENILDTINALSIKIKYHDEKYHKQDNPEISDVEYDIICQNYDELIKNNPDLFFLERSLIGSSPSIQFQKYTHKKPMGSLINAFSIWQCLPV